MLDALHRRLTFKQQTEIITAKYEAYSPVQVAIEANAYQRAQIDELRRTTWLRVREVVTVKDKVTRFLKLAARFEAGQVFVRRDQTELVEELLLAPEGAHDDLVDALDFAVSQAGRGLWSSGAERVRSHKDWHDSIPAPSWRDHLDGRATSDEPRGLWARKTFTHH